MIRRNLRPCDLAMVLALALFGAVAPTIAADPPTPAASSPAGVPATSPRPAAMEYYQVFVPADRIKELVGVGYLPMQREEFQRRLAAIQSTQAAAPALRPSIAIGEYSARLEGEALIDGVGLWRIRTAGDKIGLVELEGLDLPIAKLTWLDDQMRPSEPALAGSTADGRIALLADRAGAARFEWALRSESASPRESVFRLRLAPAPTNRLSLVLPAGTSAQIDGMPAPQIAPEPGPTPPPPGAASWQRATWELGGQTDLRLRIRPMQSDAAATPPMASLPRLRTTTIYEISPRGLQCLVLLRIDNWDATRRELRFTCDAGLKPTVIRLGETTVAWQATTADDGRTTVALALPARTPSALEVEIGAAGPIAINKAWRLPHLSVADVAWREGVATVSVLPALVLQQATGVDARQLPATSVARGEGVEVCEFQLFRATSGVEVQLAPRSSDLRLASATHLALAGDALEARQFVEFGAAATPVYDLSAVVGPGWTLEGVTTSPAELLDSWEVTKAAGGSRLSVRLARGVAGGRARLAIVARHGGTLSGASFPADALSPCRFQGPATSRYVVALVQEAGSRLNLVGDARLRRLDPLALAAPESELLAGLRPGLVFVDDEGAQGARLEVRTPQPRYSADIAIEAAVRGDQVALTYRFRCVPETANVSRLLVQFSPDLGNALSWTDDNAAPLPAVIRRLPSEGADAAPATYAIELGRPIVGSLVVRATASRRLNSSLSIPLAGLPQAVSQSGLLVVRADGQAPFSVQAQGLTTLPVDLSLPDRIPEVRGLYRFDPSRDLAVSGRGATLAPRPANAPDAACWAWRTQIQTLARPAGEMLHRADYWLENLGQTQVKLSWPAGCIGRRVTVEGLGTQVSVGRLERDEVLVPLPADARFVLLTAEYAQPQAPLAELAPCSSPCPRLDVPELARHWTLWLPYDWAAFGAEPFRNSPVATYDPAQRLLGAIHRADAAAPSVVQALSADPLAAPAADGPHRVRTVLAEIAAERLSASRPLTWGPLLTTAAGRLAAANAPVPTRLLLDDAALAQVGITPITLAAARDARGGVEPPEAWLAERGLLLLEVADGTVLLTSAVRVALWRDLDGVAEAAELPWGDHPLSSDDGESPWVTPAAWNAEPRKPQAPWDAALDSSWAVLATAGWRGYETAISAEAPVRLWVYRPERAAWLGWGLLLVALALAWWWPDGWRACLPLAIAAFAALALTLAPPWAPACSGAASGLLLGWCLAAGWPRHDASASPQVEASTIAAPVRASAPVGVVATLLLLATWTGHAAEEAPPAPEAAHKPLPVLIPIDPQQQPVGPVVYVPTPLYEMILRAPLQAENSAASLLASARYRGTLVRDNATGEYDVARMDVMFEVEVVQAGGKIVIPFAREGWFLLEDGVKLDGQPVQPQWRADDRAFELAVAAAGRYRVELAVRPSLAPLAGGMGFRWSVPPTVNARVEFAVPAESVALSVPEARGSATLDGGNWQVTLGPSKSLTVHWPLTRTAAATGEVEQLNWLRLRPGSVVLESRVKVRAARVPLAVLRWRVDPAMRLLPLGGGVLAAEPTIVRVGPGEQIVELKLARPLEAGASFTAAFLWGEVSGVGQFALPRCELADVPTSRRWLALSADSSLAVAETGATRLTSVSPAEFATAWGGGVAPPQVAFDALTGEAAWALSITPRPAMTRVVDQDLAVSLGRGEMQFLVAADLETSGGYVLQHRLDVPAGTVVESLTISELDGQRECRWAQDSSGRVTAFLAEPISGRHRLTLAARLPSASGRPLALPRIAILSAESSAQTVYLFRQPEVVVELDPDDGWTDQEPPPAFAARLVGRWLATLHESTNDPPAEVVVAANSPVVAGAQVTRMRRAGDAWEAEVDCRWQVQQGLIDSLRFDLPARIGSELRIDPALPFEVTTVPGEARKRLLVTPRAPVAGELRLRIVLPLEGALGDRRLPDVVPLDWPHLARFMVLPAQYELQAVEGELPRFQAANLPAELMQAGDDLTSQRVYQLDGRAIQAMVQRTQSSVGLAQIRLVDVHLDWQADGAARAVASFDLEPGDLVACDLKLPANCRLVHVRVAGLMGEVTPLAAQAWRIALGPRHLPQRIEVVYTAHVALPLQPTEPLLFPAPQLLQPTDGGGARELNVERILWSIRGPQWAGAGEPLQSGSRVTAPRQELIRLQSAAALVDLPADVAAELPPADIAAWYVPWVRRQVATLATLTRLRRASGGVAGDSIRDAARLIESDQLALAARFGTTGVRAQVFGDAARAYGASDLLALAGGSSGPTLRLLYKGGEPRVAVRYPAAGGDPTPRWLAAATALGLGLLVSLAAWLGWIGGFVARWPHALGVVAGILWALFCIGPWMGWLVIAVSLLLLLRGPVPDPARD